MVKLVCLSDTHCQYPNLPEGDILIHAGDWTYSGNLKYLLGEENKEISKNQNWIDNQKHKFKHIIGVAGNHDWGFTSNTFEGIKLLFDEEIEVEGLRIYGSPYTKMFCNWAFMEEEFKLQERFKRIPEGLDILVVHGPARGWLDINRNGRRCGSTALLNRLKEMKQPPKHFIFGHVHILSSGLERQAFDGKTYYHNISYVNEDYMSTGEITEILI